MTNATRRADVVVLGLGVMGAMTTWRLAASGASVIGIEQFGVAHDRGSSHGGSRIFRMTLFEGEAYLPIARTSLALYRELERESGTRLMEVSGGLFIGPEGGPIITDAQQCVRAGDVEHQLLDRDELLHRFPQQIVFEDDVAIFEPGAGVLRPEAAIRAAVDAARQAGAVIQTETRVTDLRFHDNSVEVVTDQGTLRAGSVVLATGAWFTDLVPQLGLPVGIQRSNLSWFKALENPADYRPDRFPVFVRESGRLDGWGIPDIDGRGVKIALGATGLEKPWLDRPEDNWFPPTSAELAPVESYIREAFPGVRPKVASAVACMNSKTPDGDFVLGIPSALPQVVLAGGFSGHGFKHGAGVGQIAAQLALEGGSDIPIDTFSPDRFRQPA